MGSGGGGSQVVGHKYFAGVHMVLGHGPMDRITRVKIADKVAWIGSAEGDPNGYERVLINKPGLFGGKSREGGISGDIDVAMGFPTQPANGYLERVQGGMDNRLFGTGDHIYQIKACFPAGGMSGSCDYNTNPEFHGTARGDTPQQAVANLVREKYGKIGGGIDATELTPGPEGPRYHVTALVNHGFLGFAPLHALAEQRNELSSHPAYRGVTALILRQMYLGNNPYLKPWTVRAQRVYRRGPEGRLQWYPQKAGIGGGDQELVTGDLAFSATQATELTQEGDPIAAIVINASPSEVVVIDKPPGLTYQGWSAWSSDGDPNAEGKPWRNKFEVTDDHGHATYWAGSFATAAQAEQWAYQQGQVFLSGSSQYTIWLADTPPNDNRGGMSLRIFRIDVLDMNPIHIIRECLTESWGRYLPETEIGDSYQEAADILHAEQFGLSLMWTQTEAIDDFIREIIRYIDAVRYEHPETGLQEIKLIRAADVANPETLPVLDPDNSDLEQLVRPSPTDVIGAVTVKFRNRATGTNDSLTVHDTAALNMEGGAAKKTYEYPGIRTRRLANIVAQRDLGRENRPYSKGRVRTNRKVANLLPGDPFVLVSPDEGVEFMVCRVATRSESGLLNGDITLDFAEDIYGSDHSVYVSPPEPDWEDDVGEPRALDMAVPIELPLVMVLGTLGTEGLAALNDTASFYALAVSRPVLGDHLSYRFWIYPQPEAPVTDVLRSRIAGFTPIGVLDQAVAADATVLPLSVQPDAEYIRPGQWILAIFPLTGSVPDAEWEWLGLISDIGPTITVARGVIDTVPKPLPVGTLLFFISAGLGTDKIEYMAGEIVEGYAATINGRGEYPGPHEYLPLTMQGRVFKPYPAANFRVDGELFVDESHQTTAPVLTWNHRDRLIQQDQIIDWFDATDYGPEAGTTYRVESDTYDGNGDLATANWFSLDVGLVTTYTLDLSVNTPPTNAVSISLRVVAVRDGEDSLQSPEARISVFSAPFNLSYEYLP